MKNIQQDFSVISNPNSWPRFPFLPLVDRTSGEEGLLWAMKKFRVYKVNLFDFESIRNLKNQPFEDYPSAMEIAQKYRVD